MSGYRFFDPAPVFLDLSGLKPIAGGALFFFEQGTTTPKATYADSPLSTPNPYPVPLDSAGRANVNIWGSGGYTVRAQAADGTTVWVRDVDGGNAGGAAIPALVTGRLLGNDGANLVWVDVPQVPDPSGSSGKVLGTDGANLIWVALQTVTQPDITVLANRVTIGKTGDTHRFLCQWGESTVAASGQTVAGGSASFPVPFAETPVVMAIPTSATVTSEGQVPVFAITARSATGFSVQMHTDDYGRNGARITNNVPFSWVAFGRVAA